MCKWTLFPRILIRTVGDEPFNTTFRLLKQSIFLEGDRVTAIFRGVLVTVMLPAFSTQDNREWFRSAGIWRYPLPFTQGRGAGPLVATRMPLPGGNWGYLSFSFCQNVRREPEIVASGRDATILDSLRIWFCMFEMNDFFDGMKLLQLSCTGDYARLCIITFRNRDFAELPC